MYMIDYIGYVVALDFEDKNDENITLMEDVGEKAVMFFNQF